VLCVPLPDEATRVTRKFLELIDNTSPRLVQGLYLRGSLAFGEYFPGRCVEADGVWGRTVCGGGRCAGADGARWWAVGGRGWVAEWRGVGSGVAAFGLRPRDMLLAATLVPAAWLGIDGEVGSVEVGSGPISSR
jgi:hypothetical protein